MSERLQKMTKSPTRTFCFSIVFTFSVVPFAAQAQEFCTALLQAHISDYFVKQGHSGGMSETSAKLCKQYNQHKLHKEGQSGSVGYSGFTLGLQLSESNFEAIGKSMCESTYSYSDYQRDQKVIESRLNPTAAHAILQCARAQQTGLHFDMELYGDDRMVITLRGISGTDKITAAADVLNLACGPGLKEKVAGDAIPTQLSQTCSRGGEATVKNCVEEGGLFVVHTTQGALAVKLPDRRAPTCGPLPQITAASNCTFAIPSKPGLGEDKSITEAVCSVEPGKPVTLKIDDMDVRMSPLGQKDPEVWVQVQIKPEPVAQTIADHEFKDGQFSNTIDCCSPLSGDVASGTTKVKVVLLLKRCRSDDIPQSNWKCDVSGGTGVLSQ